VGTIVIITPVFTIPKLGARAFESVDRGDTLDMFAEAKDVMEGACD